MKGLGIAVALCAVPGVTRAALPLAAIRLQPFLPPAEPSVFSGTFEPAEGGVIYDSLCIVDSASYEEAYRSSCGPRANGQLTDDFWLESGTDIAQITQDFVGYQPPFPVTACIQFYPEVQGRPGDLAAWTLSVPVTSSSFDDQIFGLYGARVTANLSEVVLPKGRWWLSMQVNSESEWFGIVDNNPVPVCGDSSFDAHVRDGAKYNECGCASTYAYVGSWAWVSSVEHFNEPATVSRQVLGRTQHRPWILLPRSTLTFFVPEADRQPQRGEFTIRNAGEEILDWMAVEDCPWLEVEPSSGETADEWDPVVVQINPEGLRGHNECVITVESEAARNAPQFVTVTLNVNRPRYVPEQYASVQSAINACLDGDTVWVADGTYRGVGNRDVRFNGKAIQVRSRNGPADCIIDCESSGVGFVFDGGEKPTSLLEGFTITRGNSGQNGIGAGVRCILSSPTILNCRIENNVGQDLGGGLGLNGYFGNITGCLIANNTSRYCGGAVHLTGSEPSLTNCTIVGNRSAQIGGAMCFYWSRAYVSNSIFWDNESDAIWYGYGWEPVISYSDIEGGWPGKGNTAEDPLFVDGSRRDFRLASGSPCIDSGDGLAVPADRFDLDGDSDELEPLPYDLNHTLRIADDQTTFDTGRGEPPIVDMGASEYDCTGLEIMTVSCTKVDASYRLRVHVRKAQSNAILTFEVDGNPNLRRTLHVDVHGKTSARSKRLHPGEHRIELLECAMVSSVACWKAPPDVAELE